MCRVLVKVALSDSQHVAWLIPPIFLIKIDGVVEQIDGEVCHVYCDLVP